MINTLFFTLCLVGLAIAFLLIRKPKNSRLYLITYTVSFSIYANNQSFDGKTINWLGSNCGVYEDNTISLELPITFFKGKSESRVREDLKSLIENRLDDATHCHGMYGSVVKIISIGLLKIK